MKTLTMLALSGLVLSACAPVAGTEPPPMSDAPDQCKASQYQSWVGRNRSALPSAPSGEIWRVSCDTCPVTMDYNPRRLNVVYDTETDVIERVACG